MAHARVRGESAAVPHSGEPAVTDTAARPPASRPPAPRAEEATRLATRLRAELDAAGLDAIDPTHAEWLAARVPRSRSGGPDAQAVTDPRAVAELADTLIERLPPPQRTTRLREQVRVAAVLHDALETTPLTTADLAVACVPDAAIRAIEALTGHDGEAFPDAVRRAAIDPLGRLVKAADLLHATEPAQARPPRDGEPSDAPARSAVHGAPAVALLLEVIDRHGTDTVSDDDLRAIEAELEAATDPTG